MGPGGITLDTAGIVAALNRRDPNHASARQVLLSERRPFLVPVGILAEVAYMIERLMGLPVLQAFVADLIAGEFVLEGGEHDLVRAGQLVERYADLPLGLADAMVIACAERNGGRVLTFDARHFGVVAREGTITVAPQL